MYATIFKIIQPYLLRFLARQAAEYLQKRREQRLSPGEDEASIPPPEAESVSEPLAMECPPQAGFSSSDAFWFTMSGVLLGGAFGFILAHLTRPEE